MTAKRFTKCCPKMRDNGEEMSCQEVEDMLNNLHEENEELKKQREELFIRERDTKNDWRELKQENEQLKTEIHLAHMRSMFSTVKSFKGDISERYVYSDEKDTIYDTANHYGQYYKILDKKEITMLLNEYETILNELGK